MNCGLFSVPKYFKMIPPYQFLLGLLLAYVFVEAAPSQSDVRKLEQIAKVETADIKLDEPITLEEATKSGNNAEQGQRHKRFYNYYGYGFPPMNPVIYPNLPNNNDPYAHNFGEDPLQQIYKRLQDIAGVIRTPTFGQPPPPVPFPILFPVIFIPQIGCGCTPTQGNRPTPNQNGTDFDISNRFPDMEDTNQNWGFVVNQNETVEDDGLPEDFNRPISFVPIQLNRTTIRPPLAVEHGSSQEGRNPMASRTTTTTPSPAAASPSSSSNRPTPPNVCDAAVLSCCHQPEVTYACFAAQGCPDPTSYGNPCDSQVILQVIERFSKFYGTMNG